MVDATWSGPLADARGPIVAALRKLLDCPEVFRPFVIVQQGVGHTEDDVFVQFAGSTERGLLFDVPAQGIVTSPCVTPEDGATRAISSLRTQGVPAGSAVRVTFESTRDAPAGFRRPASA
jgi:hypothetical protein